MFDVVKITNLNWPAVLQGFYPQQGRCPSSDCLGGVQYADVTLTTCWSVDIIKENKHHGSSAIYEGCCIKKWNKFSTK